MKECLDSTEPDIDYTYMDFLMLNKDYLYPNSFWEFSSFYVGAFKLKPLL